MHELTKTLMKLAGFEKERINEFSQDDYDDIGEDYDFDEEIEDD
jgi:hypothetical protein